MRACVRSGRRQEVFQFECLSNRLFLSHNLADQKPETKASAEFEAPSEGLQEEPVEASLLLLVVVWSLTFR